MLHKPKLFSTASQYFFAGLLKAGRIGVFPVAILLILCVPVSAQWIQQGPGPSKNGQVEGITDRKIVGAINCVAPHPTDANILYIGAVNGGVWSSTNALAASPSWTFISPDLNSQSIGALEFDPTDAGFQTLVLGNGRTSSFFGVGSGNRGIFRTTTGAGPWTNIDAGSIFSTRNVTGIAARGATIIVASNSGGIWRTTNTGGVWNQLSGDGASGLPAGNSFDLVADPSDNAVFYTNAGTGGIYKSINTGATWTKVSDAALDADLAGAGNIELAVGNSNNVYVAIVRGGRLGDVYRSGDGGISWISLDIPNTVENGVNIGIHVGGQGNTHLSLAADPSNSNVVYIGGDRQPAVNEGTPMISFPNSLGANDFSGRLFRIDASLAPGIQAVAITHSGTAGNSSPHADSRDIDFDAAGDMIESDDGGVFKQTSPADATGNWFSLVGNSNVTEIHSLDWDANSNIIISGAQDNGVPEQIFPTNSTWNNIRNGDGGDVAVDDISATATSVRYLSTQNLGGFRRRVYSSGNVFQSQVLPALTDVATGIRIAGFSFVAPLKINNQNGSRLLIGTAAALFESTDQGNTVSSIGAFAVNGNGIDALAYGAAGNADIIYAGAGNTVRIRSAAPPAAFATSAAYPGAATIQGIVIDPDDALSAYVIDATNVFETINTGANWANITGNLLALNPGTLRSIAYIPNSTDDILAVGTDLGVYIAPGPAFNVWAKLGTNLPSVGVYDLEYDNADDILLAGTMGRGAWTFNFSERDPVDVALVLDYSGSMLLNACPTCDTRLSVLKDAVEIFMQLWKGLAVEDDRIGAVYFRTTVDQYEEGGNMLLPVIDKTDAIIADVRNENTTAAQLTAMGGGLQSALNQLTDATRPRNIILFTDGMQNVNPGVVYPSLNIENGVFSTNSNINATSPATTLNAALNIKVNTIGVGATSAFESQLADIASGTNGITKITTAPDEELRRFFVEELVDVLRSFSPQLVDYRKGTITSISSESFSINHTPKQIMFKISYQRGDEAGISIFKGKMDVTRLAKRTNGSFYQIFSFPFAKLALLQGPQYDGPWEVRMRNGSSKQVKYEIAAIADESMLKYNLSLGNAPHKVGDPISMSAGTLVDGMLVTGDITVSATVDRPAQGLGTLLSTTNMPAAGAIALEPNISLGAKKFALLSQDVNFISRLRPVTTAATLSAGADHLFHGDFTNTTVPGTYTVTFKIKGNHPYTGPFERIEQRAVVLRFSNFDLAASGVLVRKTKLKTANDVLWTYQFTPKDKYGNFLGPDYGNLLQVKSTDGTIRAVKDLGNGVYEIEIVTTTSTRPHLNFGLYDEVWFDGMVPSPKESRYSLSIHAGASIPVGNFGNAFTAGWYAKLDIERRLRHNFSIQLVGGVYNFRKDLHVPFGALQLKKYFPAGSRLNLYAEAGPGIYSFSGGGNTYAGFDAGAGLDILLGGRNRFSAGVNYNGLFNHPSGYKWVTAGIGIHIGL